MNPTWWWNAIGFLPKVSPFVYFKKLKFGPSREAVEGSTKEASRLAPSRKDHI
jgi:hypothetical protein